MTILFFLILFYYYYSCYLLYIIDFFLFSYDSLRHTHARPSRFRTPNFFIALCKFYSEILHKQERNDMQEIDTAYTPLTSIPGSPQSKVRAPCTRLQGALVAVIVLDFLTSIACVSELSWNHLVFVFKFF